MKKEDIENAVNGISDRHIKEACDYKKSGIKWKIAASAAAVFAVVIAAVIVIIGTSPKTAAPDTGLSAPESGTDIINVNKDDLMVAVADMDIQIEWYDPENLTDETIESFEDRVGVSYSELTARFPEGYKIKYLWSYLSRWDENGVRHEEYTPFDYRFELAAPSGGSVIMAVCGVGEPLRDCIIRGENDIPSEINGVEMYIYKTLDQYYVLFESGGIYYDIVAKVSSEEELAGFIKSIM